MEKCKWKKGKIKERFGKSFGAVPNRLNIYTIFSLEVGEFKGFVGFTGIK